MVDLKSMKKPLSECKIAPDRRLFWFLREGLQLDLSEPSTLDGYVQQVTTRGGSEDVRQLLKTVPWRKLEGSLQRVKPFLPDEVRRFWEDFVADH